MKNSNWLHRGVSKLSSALCSNLGYRGGLRLLLLQNTDFVNKHDLVFLKRLKTGWGKGKYLQWRVVVYASNPRWSLRRTVKLALTAWGDSVSHHWIESMWRSFLEVFAVGTSALSRSWGKEYVKLKKSSQWTGAERGQTWCHRMLAGGTLNRRRTSVENKL